MIVENSKKYYVNLSINVTIDKNMAFFRGKCEMKFLKPLNLLNEFLN